MILGAAGNHNLIRPGPMADRELQGAQRVVEFCSREANHLANRVQNRKAESPTMAEMRVTDVRAN